MQRRQRKAAAFLQVGIGAKGVCQAGERALSGSKRVQGLHWVGARHPTMCMHSWQAPPGGSSHGRRFLALFVLLAPYGTLLTVKKEQWGFIPHRCLREGKQS